MASRRAVWMGHPAHFRIRGGANPHTRDRWGRRKRVDGPRALEQWDRFARQLTDGGADVHVVPAAEASPGLVFPANAGFLTRLDDPAPLGEKVFLLSRALPSRAAERRIYGDFLTRLGLAVDEGFPRRFEGEADLFRAGNVHLFTSGAIERQRFVPRWGWPPYRRAYGFRSDSAALELLRAYVPGTVLALTLTLETHYHGDTCLCAFGRNREFLMVYLPALSVESQSLLRDRFRERLLPLGEDDGRVFAANSFQLDGAELLLFMPAGASPRLRDQVRERGAVPVTVDVSEFMERGGGSVKCLVGDLGPAASFAGGPPEAERFREDHRFKP